MKALVLNCCPVRDGATAFIARRIAERLRERFDTEEACIDDYEISFCRGCRACHKTAVCVIDDGVKPLMEKFGAADVIVCVSPSYWADIPGEFKAFIDRCTPWCDTHEPHLTLPSGKRGYSAALRTGGGKPECLRVISSIEHFYGHLGIAASGSLALTGVECLSDAEKRTDEIDRFTAGIL